MKTNATLHLLEDKEVKFWWNSIWPGNSPDMNPAEDIGAIIKDKVEELMTSEYRQNRYNHDILKTNLEIGSHYRIGRPEHVQIIEMVWGNLLDIFC